MPCGETGKQTSFYMQKDAAEVFEAVHAHMTEFAEKHHLPRPSRSHTLSIAVQAAALGMLPDEHPLKHRLQEQERQAAA